MDIINVSEGVLLESRVYLSDKTTVLITLAVVSLIDHFQLILCLLELIFHISVILVLLIQHAFKLLDSLLT